MCLLNYAIYVFIMEPYRNKPFILCPYVSMKPTIEHVHMCCCIMIKSMCWMFNLGLTKGYTVYKEQKMSVKVAISPTHFLFSVDLMSQIRRFLYLTSLIKDSVRTVNFLNFLHLMSLDIKCFPMQGHHLFHLAFCNAWLKILQTFNMWNKRKFTFNFLFFCVDVGFAHSL